MAQLYTASHVVKEFPRTCLRGIGQVMFQDNMWTGLLFTIVGATGRDIMMQFLIEAVILSVTGGILGILIGAFATWMISIFANWPVAISTASVVLSFAVCTIIGIVFGFYPAAKASRLDPIEAIRYE